MGKRRRRRSRSSSGFWTEQYGGMPVWGIVAAIAVVAALGAGFALSQAGSSTAAPEPQRTARTEFSFSTRTEAPKPLAVFIGDSYTAGAGSTEGGFAPIVAREQGWRIENLGRGGTGFITRPNQSPSEAQNACGLDYCESYPEMIPAAAALSPDVVVVSGGRNNAGDDPEETQKAVSDFFSDLRQALPEARIIVTSPIWDDNPTPAAIRDLSDWERAAASEVGGEFVTIGQPLEGNPGLLSSDGVHPNDDGHAAIAAQITARLSD